jgi:hypothetical protein
MSRPSGSIQSAAKRCVLWLLLFGEVFSHIRAIPTGKRPYLD